VNTIRFASLGGVHSGVLRLSFFGHEERDLLLRRKSIFSPFNFVKSLPFVLVLFLFKMDLKLFKSTTIMVF
jgi:hypothetical protein